MLNEIEFNIENQIATLRVNRPQARNALNWVAQEQFAEAVTAVSQNNHIRVLIITGTGSRAFVAGGDLKELNQHPERAGGERLNCTMRDVLTEVNNLAIPVIVAINGDAFGGGCEIITACDIRVATARAQFSFAQIRNGLTTGWGGTARLVRLIGQSRAMELLLTGRLIDVNEAKAIGLIHQIVEKDMLETAVNALANQLIQLPRDAMTANKKLVQHAAAHSQQENHQLETELFTTLWTHPDHLEAMRAFSEKRMPRFGTQ